jgi:hypothetical protein
MSALHDLPHGTDDLSALRAGDDLPHGAILRALSNLPNGAGVYAGLLPTDLLHQQLEDQLLPTARQPV